MRELARKIAAEISISGAIPFDRFMELALYCPVYGYYEKEPDTIGRGGDYFTSVSVGSLFGELLAFQFADWLSPKPEVQGPSPKLSGDGTAPGADGGETVEIVEAGAHQGQLAMDILNWLRQMRSPLFERLTYWIVEPSARRQEWQRSNLREFKGKVRWAANASELGTTTPRPTFRVIFANEFLDAFPVRRLAWDARKRRWFEWGVGLNAETFVWTKLPGSGVGGPRPGSGAEAEPEVQTSGSRPAPFPVVPDELLEILPDGFAVEVCPAAEQWWGEAAGLLGSGKLLTIDYGLTEAQAWMPERVSGTLRAYRRHRCSGEVLIDPGEQDITAHVRFSSLQRIGEAAGLRTEAFATQEQFLTGIAASAWERLPAFGEWTRQRKRQFQTLTHPEHLGGVFRVLVQGRWGER